MCYLFAVALICGILVILLWRDTVRPAGFPPGPYWLPWFGNSLLLRKLSKKYKGPHGVYEYLSKKYNSQLIGVRLGRERAVTVLGYSLAREALNKDKLSGRPDNFFTRMRTAGTRLGLTLTDGKHWEEHKTFILRTFKELGYGRQPMEDMIQRELQDMIIIIGETDGPIVSGYLLPLSVLNVLWTLATGKRIERNNRLLHDLLTTLKKRSKLFDIAGGILNQLPWLRFIVPNWSGYNLLQMFNKQLSAFFTDTIRDHSKNFNDANSQDDLIYAYMREIRKRSDDPHTTFTEKQMIMTILDLFIAGAQNTSIIIDLALMMMIRRPDIQARVHDEIDQFNGSVCWSNHHHLPYTAAVTQEVQRYFHTSAISGPRRAMEDCEVGGYKIPKDTTVFVDLKSIHMDPDYWIDPENFRPERFLDDSGNLINCDHFIPFSLGKRRCLGDTLARACIFTYFAGLLQQFKVGLPEGETELPSMELTPGITYLPETYQAAFRKRIK